MGLEAFWAQSVDKVMRRTDCCDPKELNLIRVDKGLRHQDERALVLGWVDEAGDAPRSSCPFDRQRRCVPKRSRGSRGVTDVRQGRCQTRTIPAVPVGAICTFLAMSCHSSDSPKVTRRCSA